MGVADIRVDRLMKLSEILKTPKELWAKHPSDGVPDFDLQTWSNIRMNKSGKDDYGNTLFNPKDVCGTTACACGLYAITYPEDGLELTINDASLSSHKFEDLVDITQYQSERATGLRYKDEKTGLHLNDYAAESFFGLQNITINYKPARDYFFFPHYYLQSQLNDPLAVAKRIDLFLECLKEDKYMFDVLNETEYLSFSLR